MMKRITIVLFAVVLVLFGSAAFAATVFAAEIVQSGTCGDNVTWTLDRDGLLTISGTGAMEDYSSVGAAPYAAYDVQRLIVGEGVTGIGNYAFSQLALDYIMLPENLISIGRNAFKDATIAEAHYAGDLRQWEKEVTVADGNGALTSIIIIDKPIFYE